MSFGVLAYLTGLIVVVFALLAWLRHRDPFHPMFYIGPMLIFLYSAMPLMLTIGKPEQLQGYLNQSELIYVQTLNLIGTLCICAGILLGSGPAVTWHRVGAQRLSPAVSRRLARAAVVLGGIGLAAYAYMLVNAGGLEGAYGRAFGGVWADTGYVRDLQLLTIAALLLLLTAHGDRRLSTVDWAWIVLFASPWLLHGLLGARRGPTFVTVAALFVGWYLQRGRRPPLVAVLTGGVVLGCLMLFLLDNRDRIYLGSHFKFEPLETSVLGAAADPGPGNEFVYGAGTILNADDAGEYWWGRRYLVVFFVRPIPRFLWPSKYQAASAMLGVPDMEFNLGTGGDAFHSSLSWAGARGAAPGIVADMWIEFWLGAFPALFVFGWWYGRTWRRAIDRGGLWTTVYGLMFALSVYLIMQTLEAMAVRFLETALPAWLAWRYALATRVPAVPARPRRRAAVSLGQT
jgi:hypothetical protein